MEEEAEGGGNDGRGRRRGPSPFPHPFPLIPSFSPPISTIFTSPIHFHPLSHPLLIHSTVLGMKSKRPWVRLWVVGMDTLDHGYPGSNPYPYP